MDFQTALMSDRGRRLQTLEMMLDAVRIAGEPGFAIGAGVELDDSSPHGFGDGDLDRVRLDEERDPAAGLAQLPHEGRDGVVACSDIETALGGALLTLFRHQADRMRLVAQGDVEHFRRCRHFQIERQVDLGHQPVDIRVADMATVFAQVRGDPVGACLRRLPGRAHGIRMIAAPGVPDRGHVIDIDAETNAHRPAPVCLPEGLRRGRGCPAWSRGWLPAPAAIDRPDRPAPCIRSARSAVRRHRPRRPSGRPGRPRR